MLAFKVTWKAYEVIQFSFKNANWNLKQNIKPNICLNINAETDQFLYLRTK